MGEDTKRRFNKQEPLTNFDINKLPTLDKPKKIDELLEQLSIETNPAKKEQIKQHIERIKRGSLKQADELGEPVTPLKPAEDRGSKQISKYDPEYSFLVRLVKLLSKEVPEAIPEIKALSQSQPFFTVDDVGNLTAKIWTLATTKYNIPREWLISKLPEPKTKQADLWPAQEETENMLTQSPGAIAFNNPKDTTVCGPNPQDIANEDALWDIVVNEFLTAHKRWSEVVKAIRLAHPEVTDSVILSLKDRVKKSLDNQMGFTASKKVAYHAISDLTQFALDDKEIRQHFQNRGTAIEDVIASLPNFKIEYTPRELELQDPSLKDTTKGFYNYQTGTLYINPRISLDAKRITIIHEIEHAIQDSIGELPVHTPEDIYKVRQTPYEERTFELGAKQQQFNALRQRGMGLVEIINYWMKRYGYPETSRELLENELEQFDAIYDQMMPESVMASKKISKKKLNIDKVIKILDSKENKVDHIDFTDNSITLVNGDKLTFDEATTRAMEMDKTAEGEFTGAEFSTDAVGVNPSMDSGPWASPEDSGAKDQEQPFPNTNWVPADDENKDEQPYSNVASSKKAFCKKEANPSTRYWIAPDGKEFDAGSHHGVWIKTNKQILKQYGIPFTTLGMVWDNMIKSGWVRVSNEKAGAGFQIQVQDLRSIPAFVDDFIARNFKDGDIIEMGDQNGNLFKIADPFPSIQKAVNKALRNPVNASKKQAAISGQIIRDILEIVESSGGISYSLSKGNLSGTDNYAVSIYPDKERIVDGVVDFDDIQNYIDTNEDLLNQPDNSLGIWSSNGKIYYDIVITIPDKEKALELAKQNNQLAIFDLKNLQEISTGIVRAFSKKTIVKKAEESVLPEEQQNQVAAKWCPAMNIALVNYSDAVKNGHEPQRAFDYALQSVSNIDSSIKESDLREAISAYLGPEK